MMKSNLVSFVFLTFLMTLSNGVADDAPSKNDESKKAPSLSGPLTPGRRLPLLGESILGPNREDSPQLKELFEVIDRVRKEQGNSESLSPLTKPVAATQNQLSEMGRTMQGAMAIVGAVRAGHGTAFVISREHRLLVTNAHVADFTAGGRTISAIRNQTTVTYKVERVWYHPGVLRNLKDALPVRSIDPEEGHVNPNSPDIAVLQLSKDGPDLPLEFPLATWDEIKDLFGLQIGMLGYPGYNTDFPEPGHKPVGTFHDGLVSRLTNFINIADVDDVRELQKVQHTASSFPGFSGSPIFLPNGHVVCRE